MRPTATMPLGIASVSLEAGYRLTTKISLALLTFATIAGAASAQQRTFYDPRGNVVGRSSINSSGTVTTYDARGNVIDRESTSGNTTTIYDARGRNIGRFTTNR